MAAWLKTTDPDFEERFTALLAQKREQAADVNAAVADIIARVRQEGDQALTDLTLAYDALDLRKAGIRGAAGRDRGGSGQGGHSDAARRFNSRMTASWLTTSGSFPRTTSIKTRSGSSSARAGRRWPRPAFTCRAARQAIRARC